jgi:hypothetical protein
MIFFILILCIFKRNQSCKALTAEIISTMAWEIGKYLVPDPDPREPNHCGSESSTLPPNYFLLTGSSLPAGEARGQYQ